MLAAMDQIENYNSPKAIRAFLERNGMAASRRFGQNFLIDQSMREKIIALLELPEEAAVWEIGPGLGAMTQHLIDKSSELVLFEIDKRFIQFLSQLYQDEPKVEIVAGDVLKSRRPVFEERGVPDGIIGNLPYNSAAAIIAELIEQACLPPKLVFTVQKEVGERMLASPGTRDYSAFSILCQSACTVSDGGNVAASCFYPQPHVTSKVVVLEPHGGLNPALLPMVSRVSRALFSSRRKTIRNTLLKSELAAAFGQETLLHILEETGIDPQLRGEVLSVQEIHCLAERISGNQIDGLT